MLILLGTSIGLSIVALCVGRIEEALLLLAISWGPSFFVGYIWGSSIERVSVR